MICLMLVFSAAPVFADVSQEVIVGLEADSSKEVKSSLGAVSVDQTDSYKTANALLLVQYTRFFAPLKDDGTPVELRRFLQHPSTLSVGLGVVAVTIQDSRNPAAQWEGTGSASLLMLGGEYYFPTDTGVFLSLGGGSGTFEQTVNGVKQPDTDVSLGMHEFGVRQYVAPNVELHLALTGESVKSKGGTESESKTTVTLLGVQGVIRNTVGLFFEIGGGERTDQQTGTADKDYDVTQMNIAIAVYAGNQLSFRLDVEAEGAKQTGLPAGFEYTESEAQMTFSAAYWFSERFGMQLPIYTVTKETKTVVAPIETKRTEKNSGIGLYAGFRF